MSLTNQVYLNELVTLGAVEIRATGTAFRIFSPINSSTPAFEIDSTTGMKINGDLSVIGTVTFEDSKVNEITSPLTFVGSGNTGDAFDLGIIGEYLDGTVKYAGIYRNSADVLRRWTFAQGLGTKPTNTVTGLSGANLASILADKVYLNDGTISAPSVTFDGATGLGMYKASSTSFGLAVNGDATLFTTTGIQMPASHILQTANLSPRTFNTLSGPVTSGATNVTSATNQDSWMSFNSVSSAFAGTVFTGSATSYFCTNNTNVFQIGSVPAVSTTTPDYRSATAQFSLSTSFARFNSPLQLPYGTLASGSLAMSFTLEQTLGIYRVTANTMSLVSNLERILDISNTAVTSNKPLVISATSPSSASPALQFPNGTGLFNSGASSLVLTLGATIGDAIQLMSFASKPQVYLPWYGTLTNPSLAILNNGTGFYTNPAGSTVNIAAQAGLCGSFTSQLTTFPVTVSVPCGFLGATSRYTTNLLGSSALQICGGVFSGSDVVLDPTPIEARGIILGYYGTTSNAATDTSDANRSATISTTSISGAPFVATYVSDAGSAKTIKYALDFASENSQALGTRILNLTPHLASYASLTNFSISFWYKLSTITDAACIFHAYNTLGKEIAIEVLANGLFQIQVNSDTANTLLVTVSGANTNNAWQHITINFGASGIFFYRNGVSAASNGTITLVTNTGPTNCFANLSNITVLTIGARWNGTQMINKFTGHLARVYMTPTALTLSQIQFFQSDTQKFRGFEVDVNSVRARSVLVDDSLGSLTLPAGSASAPSLAFTSTSGLFYESSPEATVSITAGGSKILGAGASLLTSTRPVKISNSSSAVQFENTVGGGGIHSIASAHAGTLSGNSLNVRLWSTADASGVLGTHTVATLQQRTTTIGQLLCDEFLTGSGGTLANPAFSSQADPDTGLFFPSANTLGVTCGGALRADFSSTNTNVYGTLTLPTNAGSGFSLAFDDPTTGFRSVAGDLTLLTKNVSSMVFTNAAVTTTLPTTVTATSADGFRVQNAGGTVTKFGVDTQSGGGIRFEYNNQRLKTPNGATSTNQFLNLESTQTGAIQGLQLISTLSNGLSGIPAFVSVGYDYTAGRAGMMAFRHTGVPGADGTLSLGMGANGTFTTECIRITPTEVQFLVPLTTNTAIQFSEVIGLASGSVSAPSLYIGATNTGLYSSLAGTVSVTAAATNTMTFASTATTAVVPLRLAAGSAGAPSLTLSSDATTGIYGTSGNFRISASSSPVFNFTSSAVEALTNFAITPNGASNRVTFTNTKMQASPGQTILAGAPILYLDYSSNPNTFPTQQDSSINKTTIQVNGTVAYNTSLINLTDANGTTLFNTQAIETSAAGNNGIETTSAITGVTLMNTWSGYCQFKVKSVSGTQLIWGLYGNKAATSNNYIEVYQVNTAIFVAIRLNGTNHFVAQLNTAIAVNVWYRLRVGFSASVITAELNGAAQTFSYTTGSIATGFTFLLFTDTSNIAVYNCASPNRNSLGLYLYEFSIIPISISQAASLYYTEQLHELYVNKLQLQTVNTSTGISTGYVEEGMFLISDSAGNAQWDGSIKATPTSVQSSATKTVTIPNSGTAAIPALAIGNGTGLYSSATSVLNFSIGSTGVASISASAITSTLRLLLPNGTAGAPVGSFTSSPTTGFFSAGSNDFSIAANGSSVLSCTTARALLTAPLQVPLGSAGAPSITSSSSSTSGLYFFNAGNSIGASIQSADVVQIAAALVTSLQPIQVPVGTVSAPSVRFAGSATTGFYSAAANDFSITSNGTSVLSCTTARLLSTAPLQLPLGSAGAPSLTSSSSSTSGLYFFNAGNSIAASIQSADVLQITSTLVNSLQQLQVPNGTVSLPSLRFGFAANTGIYASAAANIDFAIGGINRLNMTNVTTTFATSIISTGNTSSVRSLATNTGSGGVTAVFDTQSANASRAAGFLISNTASTTHGAYFGTRYQGGSTISNLTLQASTTAFTGAGTNSSGLDLLIIGMDTGQVQYKVGTASLPTICWQGDTNTGIYSSAADNIDFSTGGTNRVNISSTGTTFVGAVTTGAGATTVSGPLVRGIQTVTTNTTLSATTGGSVINTTSAVTVTLPAATNGLEFYVVNTSSGITVIATGTPASEFFNGNSGIVTLPVAQNDRLHLVAVGTNWYTF
jgi:hypothetical protein